MNNISKEQIEQALLCAMKSIDSAKSIIVSEENMEEFNHAYNELTKAKSDIKRILNAQFDRCARNRQL